MGFIDPSADIHAPGWPLRNLLYLLNKSFHVNKVRILSYRQGAKVPSTLFHTELPNSASYTGKHCVCVCVCVCMYDLCGIN